MCAENLRGRFGGDAACGEGSRLQLSVFLEFMTVIMGFSSLFLFAFFFGGGGGVEGQRFLFCCKIQMMQICGSGPS